MPPKRQKKVKVEEEEEEEQNSKKQKIQQEDSPNPPSSPSSEDETKPLCKYGAECYRKNPDHFKAFRHPKELLEKKIQPKKQEENKVIESNSELPSNHSYSTILRAALSKNKISADDKRLLRSVRKTCNISDEEHRRLLKFFGWTVEEYDDGEKLDSVDLPEELEILAKDDGFKIINIRKDDANKNKDYFSVFSKVQSLFYSTLSKAQANFTVTCVGVVVNSKLLKEYNQKRAEIAANMNVPVKELKEEWGFHGTSIDSIQKIVKTGFLHPDNLVSGKTKKGAKTKGKKKKDKPVELLDDGYFGKGIYFTKYADYALWYSDERNSDQVLLSSVVTGKAYQCKKRMDGKGCQKGYHSHSSPKGNEIVVFDSAQILPRYIITVFEKEAEEREQES